LTAIAEMMPKETQFPAKDLPELGNLTYTLDMTEGILKTRYSMSLDDIQKMAGYFKEIGEAAKAGSTFETSPAQEGGVQAQAEKPKLDKNNPQYWINKGDLFATYGNDRRAIEHYQKAIDLDPNSGKAFFHLGVSYGAIGQYGQALDAINRAIFLNPQDGDNYYARGWIYLRAGNKEKAMTDMKQAAELGNSDAKKYLDSIGQRYQE
jgi:tetratricopeptide (TPR) repeat protein